MVVSEEFIWLHMPKTAGDATLLMFKRLDCRWRLMDEHTDRRKHGTLAEAHARVPGSEHLPVIANLRRLPEVALSYYHHMQRHGPDEVFANFKPWKDLSFRDYLGYVIEHPDTQTYDWIINHFVGDRDVDRWLRVSDLAESFVRVIGAYHPLPPSVRETIRTIRANIGGYDARDPTTWFSREEMQALYHNSPRWAKCEMQEYGTLLPDVLEWPD